MPVDRKANDSVGYFGKMPYSGYFGSPFSVGWVGYFGKVLPRQNFYLAAAILRDVRTVLGRSKDLFKLL